MSNDRDKLQFCEMNDIQLVEIYKKEELLETIMQKKYIASIIGILAVSSYLIIIWVIKLEFK